MRNRSKLAEAFFKRSILYPLFNTLRFEENMRLPGLRIDKTVDVAVLQFLSFLVQAGEGEL